MLDQQRALHNPQAWNRYSYVENNPLNKVNPDGRETLWINRWIGSYRAVWFTWSPMTHSFIATTSGGVIHTYSWGNTPDQFTQNGWNENTTYDLIAALQAVRGERYSVAVDPAGPEGSLDPYVKRAFDILKNDPKSNHPNGGIGNNCKTEAARLLDLALKLQQADAEERQKKARQTAPKSKPDDDQ